MKWREIGAALGEAVRDFLDDHAQRHAAALSFYAILSFAPLLLVLLSLAGMIVDREALATQLTEQMRNITGAAGADIATTVIEHSKQREHGAAPPLIGLAILLFGATGVFVQLQESMNAIWEVTQRPHSGIGSLLRKRLLSVGILLALAFLLIASLAVSAALAAFSQQVADTGYGSPLVWEIAHNLLSIAVFTGLFALMYRFLPDASVCWRDVWMGALFTALLFTLGKFAIGLYLGKSAAGAPYGAAGSLILLLLWIYYSSLIVLFGAEFTQVHARRSGSDIRPAASAAGQPAAC